jgi:hypothetical protein
VPHAGQVSVSTPNTRVLVGGQPVATLADTDTVAGCPFQIPTPVGPKPQPCVRVQWIVPAARVRIGGQPALLQSSSGLCLSVEQIPQGPPNVAVTQMRARGT